MITMNASLRDLCDKGEISGQQAYLAANDKRKFKQYKEFV